MPEPRKSFQIAVSVKLDDWERFKARTAKEGRSAAAAVGDLVTSYVASSTRKGKKASAGLTSLLAEPPGLRPMELPSRNCCKAVVGQRDDQPLYCGREPAERRSLWCIEHHASHAR